MRGISEEWIKDALSVMESNINNPGMVQAVIAFKTLLDHCYELNDWKPIDSNTPAKKEILLFYQEETIDGTDFFAMQCVGLYIPEYKDVCRQPTHWQELPKPPEK